MSVISFNQNPLKELHPARGGATVWQSFTRLSSALRRSSVGYLLLLPSLVFLALFTYGGIALVIRDSLLIRHTPKSPAVFAGLANFQSVLQDPAFIKALTNNAIYAVGTLVPSLILALGIALALAQSSRVNAVLRTAFFLPVLIPLVAAASLFLFIFLPGIGLLDHYLGKVFRHLPNWLGDPDIALISIMLITIWKNAGYYMLFFLAGLQSVPADAYEASYLDGATPFQRLRYITLPYLKPTFAFVVVIALLNAVTQVDQVFILTKGGPSNATNLLLFYIYEQATEHYDIGKASAATLISLVALMVLTATSLRSMKRAYGGKA